MQIINKNSVLQLLVLVSLAACGKSEPPATPASQEAESTATGGNSGADQAALQITADYMREIVVEIADDKYEGRGPGSAGDAAARKYLAKQLKEMGVLPGAAFVFIIHCHRRQFRS